MITERQQGRASGNELDVTLSDLLGRLEPLQEKVVRLVYFEGRTEEEAARVLTVERVAVGAALAAAFRRIARWVIDEDVEVTTFPPTRLAAHREHDRA